MATRFFPAIAEAGSDGFYAHFPDLPGCVSHGATLEALAANAEQALALHLAGMREDGESIPEPTPLETLEPAPDVQAVARLLIRAELPGRAIRLNISMEEGLVASLDAEAKRRQTTRSALLATAVKRELAANR